MLEKVNFDEARQSQLPFIELLLNMGYNIFLQKKHYDNAVVILLISFSLILRQKSFDGNKWL
jgi:hypothetical protein